MCGACLAQEYKLPSLMRNGLQGLLGALQRVLAKIMLVLQMVLAFSNRLRNGWEALCGVHWAWQGNLIGQVYRLAEGLVCGLTKGLYQWLAVCGIGLASIRA